ncbi:MAG: hypothetical protein HY894_04510 [Deltaproteobacteria bacterium]|nr:hypothetical protein [Deltaproteobacteria bacterium]
MKRIAEVIIGIVTVLILRIPSAYAEGTSSAAGKGLRDQLISNDTIELVYPIDGHYTFVAGTEPRIELGEGYALAYNAASPNGTLRYMIIKHASEPFAYKGRMIPAYDAVAAPADGTFNLSSGKGRPAGYSAIDLFAEMNALCNKVNGSPTFVVPVSYGVTKRLTRVSPVDAFSYILTSSNRNSTWFLACDGAARFVVEKEYNFSSRASDTASFYAGRLLEGVNYVKDGGMVNRREARIMAIEESDRMLEATAIEVAAMRTGFVKAVDGSRFVGTYDESAVGARCADVSVKYVPATPAGAARLASASVYDFKVCNNKAARIGQRVEKDTRSENAYATTLIEPLAR